ncbi:hypothetical protein BDV09DRAFT_72926 [Aspergillus tetrazonus]
MYGLTRAMIWVVRPLRFFYISPSLLSFFDPLAYPGSYLTSFMGSLCFMYFLHLG